MTEVAIYCMHLDDQPILPFGFNWPSGLFVNAPTTSIIKKAISVSQPSGASDISTSTSAIISLNTGDYVEFRAGSAGGIRLYMDDYHTFIRIESVE